MEQVRDAGNTFPLLDAGGGHQSAGGDKQHLVQPLLSELVEDISAEDRGGTATSRATCMDVLLFSVVDHQTAVVMPIKDTDSLAVEQFDEKLAPDLPQISGEDQIVIRRGGPCILQECFYGIACGGGKCQENTINFLKKFFRRTNLENYGCCHGSP